MVSFDLALSGKCGNVQSIVQIQSVPEFLFLAQIFLNTEFNEKVRPGTFGLAFLPRNRRISGITILYTHLHKFIFEFLTYFTMHNKNLERD